MAHVQRTLIVGGGIAGLSLAIALHQRSFKAELIEHSPTWPTFGAGINLPANGVRVLRALGVGSIVSRSAAVLRRWDIFDDHGELICGTDVEEFWREVGPCLGITRLRLQEALLAGAAAVPHRLDVSITQLSQNEDYVHVGFSDGTSGDYELVVGADGIHSTVRRLIVSTSSPSYAG